MAHINKVLGCLAQECHWAPDRREILDPLSAEAVAMARRLGDPATLAQALSARNLAVWCLDNPAERIANGAEVITLAGILDDALLEAVGHAYRALGLAELDRVEEGLAELAEAEALAERFKDPSWQAVLDVTQGVLAMVEGRFDKAEQLMLSAFGRGQEVSDPNAGAMLTWGIALLRTLQGRSAELIGLVDEFRDLSPLTVGITDSMVVAWHAELGQADQARALMDTLDPSDPGFSPPVSTVISLQLLARSCFQLRDVGRAGTVYERLAPYAAQNAWSGGFNVGAVQHGLGLTAAALGRYEIAEQHFSAALAVHRRNGWRPLVVETLRFHALMLAEQGLESDRPRLREMLDEVIADGKEMGMVSAVAEAQATKRFALGVTAPEVDAGGASKVRHRDRIRARVTARGRKTVARWTVGRADDDLQRRFGSNLAQQALFTAMTRSFQPSMAFGFEGDMVIELRPPDDNPDPSASDWWTIEVGRRKATARRGRSDVAAVVVHARLSDFVRLAAGELHALRALNDRIVSVDGDVVLAARIPEIFGSIEPIESPA